MSVRVDIDALAEQIAAFGPTAYLVTVRDDLSAHVASVTVELTPDGAVRMEAGRTSLRNAAERPSVTLLWAAPPEGAYSLLVDGTASPAEGDGPAALSVAPTSAVLHRVAGRDDGPGCVPVGEGAPG